MCIMLCNIGNPKHPLILGSNRDEFFDRQTGRASFVTPDIVMPIDLQRDEHGTWIGVNRKSGRLCVLVNYYEETFPHQLGLLSRGYVSRSFLSSDMQPLEWVESIKKETNNFEMIGAFSMFFGIVRSNVDLRESLFVISNREGEVIKPFANNSRQVFGLSNCSVSQPWPKVLQGEDMFSKLTENMEPASAIAATVFDLMSQSVKRNPEFDDDTYLQNTIFVPAINRYNKGLYGTRTQTAIVFTKETNGYSVLYQERNWNEEKPQSITFLIGGSS